MKTPFFQHQTIFLDWTWESLSVRMGRRDLDYDEVLRYIGQFGTFQVGQGTLCE